MKHAHTINDVNSETSYLQYAALLDVWTSDMRTYPQEVANIANWNRYCDPGYKIPAYSPWGAVDGGRVLADGIVQVHTPGHGGIHLDEERLRFIGARPIPDSIRRPDCWYEEDCDWALVAAVYPHAFPSRMYDSTKGTLEQWHGSAWSELLATDPYIRAYDDLWSKQARAFLVDKATTPLVVYHATDYISDVVRNRVRADLTRDGLDASLADQAWMLVRTGQEIHAPPAQMTLALVDHAAAKSVSDAWWRTSGSNGWPDPYPTLADVQYYRAKQFHLLRPEQTEGVRIRYFTPFGISLPEHANCLRDPAS